MKKIGIITLILFVNLIVSCNGKAKLDTDIQKQSYSYGYLMGKDLLQKEAEMDVKSLNAGIKDGVQNKMAVVNYRGLVGRIIDPSINNSKVLLLTDQNSSVSVKTISDGSFALIKGSEDGIHLVSSFIKEDKMPKLGDLLITSGTAQIFPPDILVGKINKIDQNRFYVLPFVDFNNLDYVQVVKSE